MSRALPPRGGGIERVALERLSRGEHPTKVAAITGVRPDRVEEIAADLFRSKLRARDKGGSIDETTRESIRASVKAGASRKDAARKHGVSFGFVVKLCSGMPPQPGSRQADPDLSQKIHHAVHVEGAGRKETARRFGISPSSVNRHLLRAVGLPPKGEPTPRELVEKILESVNAGRSRAEVAHEHGLSLSRVSTIVSRTAQTVPENTRRAARYGVREGLGRKILARHLDVPVEALRKLCADLPKSTGGVRDPESVQKILDQCAAISTGEDPR